MKNKYDLILDIILPNFSNVLDVGCRDKVLKRYINKKYNNFEYLGIDLINCEDEEILCYDLEKPLPIKDSSYDIVIALDVLEHVDNIHLLYKELLRVSKKQVIVAFPNEYYWKFRLKYLFGLDIDIKKYRLPKEAIKDRHRWITHYFSVLEFVKYNTPSNYKIDIFLLPAPRKRFKFLMKIDKIGIKIFPNLFSYHIVFSLIKV